MKTKFYLLVLCTSMAYCQVGINTTSPNISSALDVTSTNKGILIPRINLTGTTDTATINSPATSLLIYNLSTVSDVTPGFYYWDTNWKRLSTSSSSTMNWSLSGNTIGATDFIGSINYSPFVLKTNATQVGRFHPNGGVSIGIGAIANDNNSVAIGNNALSSANNEALAIGKSANASGYRASAIGNSAIASNNDATALGFSANASGFRSTALGYGSIASNNDVIALGYSANASGFQSTAIGSNSVSTNNNTIALGHTATASGLLSSAIGYGTNVSGQNATVIGYNATTSQADAIILGSSSNANNKIGIGTNTPDERLHIAGSIKIVDGTQGSGKVLTSDANGKASWVQTIKSYGSAHYNGGGFTLSGTSNFTLGGTNASQGVTINADGITVLTAGVYKISYTICLSKSGGASTNLNFNLYRNGSLINGSLSTITIGNGERNTVGSSLIVTLSANDKISIQNVGTDSNVTVLQYGTSLNVESI